MTEPYVGPYYHETRLLLLGESAYSWEEDGVLRHPADSHATDLVDWTIDNFGQAPRFMKMVSRALAGSYYPSPLQLRHAWDRVAFMNYVAGSVGVGPRVRPTDAMWCAARERFLHDTIPKLAPRRIVVLGKTMWEEMPPVPLYITDDVQGYANPDGSIALCWAVNHPSRGLSWGKLAEIVQFANGDILRLPDGA